MTSPSEFVTRDELKSLETNLQASIQRIADALSSTQRTAPAPTAAPAPQPDLVNLLRQALGQQSASTSAGSVPATAPPKPVPIPEFADNPTPRPRLAPEWPGLFSLHHSPEFQSISKNFRVSQAHEAKYLAPILSYLFDVKEVFADLRVEDITDESIATVKEHLTALYNLVADRWSLLVFWSLHPDNPELLGPLEASIEGEFANLYTPSAKVRTEVEKLRKAEAEARAKEAAKSRVTSRKLKADRPPRSDKRGNSQAGPGSSSQKPPGSFDKTPKATPPPPAN